jgi:hypothetical protein
MELMHGITEIPISTDEELVRLAKEDLAKTTPSLEGIPLPTETKPLRTIKRPPERRFRKK